MMGMEMKETNNRMPSQIVYSPATQRARLGQADAALMAELEQDSGVQAARAAKEQAEARLIMAEQHKDSFPYPTGPKPAPHRLRDWQNAAAAWTEAKVAVQTAEKAVQTALNAAAKARHTAARQNEEQARAQRREAEVAQHAALEEANFREQAYAAAIASGMTREQFNKAFEGLWRAELKRRTEARMGQERAAMIASGRYSL